MIGQPIPVVYSRIRGCELIPVIKASRSQVHPKLTEVHRVTSHNLTTHQIRVCQTIQSRQEVGRPTRVSSRAKADVCAENLLKEYTVALSERVVETHSGTKQLNWKCSMPHSRRMLQIGEVDFTPRKFRKHSESTPVADFPFLCPAPACTAAAAVASKDFKALASHGHIHQGCY
eukprot:1160267-Pelagomonas_calceolata.AAC.4